MTLHIDIISDVVCPWCYIGKRRLEQAVHLWRQRHPHDAIELLWHAFELNPDMPPKGMDRQRYLEQKFGGSARAAEVYAPIEGAGKEVGIPFNFGAIRLQPNTLNAHRLIAWAAQHGKQSELVEALFHGYFIEGCDLTDDRTLIDLAADTGLERKATEAFVTSGDGRDEVKRAETAAFRIGVQGVPFFIFNGRQAVSGAQAADILLVAMEQAQQAPLPHA